MRLRYRRQFLKDLARLPGEVRSRVEALVFDEVPAFETLIDVRPRPRKLRGFSGFYRIRIGDYRVGFRVEQVDGAAMVTMERVLHRREIYRRFP